MGFPAMESGTSAGRWKCFDVIQKVMDMVIPVLHAETTDGQAAVVFLPDMASHL